MFYDNDQCMLYGKASSETDIWISELQADCCQLDSP